MKERKRKEGNKKSNSLKEKEGCAYSAQGGYISTSCSSLISIYELCLIPVAFMSPLMSLF
jgi:hypothetical protein